MKIKTGQKMKRSIYKSGLLLLTALLTTGYAASAQGVSKQFHKEYNANANTTLEISNKYGDVNIESWDKDQVVIDVKVTVELPNAEKAEKLLGYIDVHFSEGENRVTARTVIDDKFNYSGWGMSSKRFSIDYTVKMPAATALTLSNRYGNTDINDLSGLIDLDIKYGNLNAGKLTRGNIKPLNRLSLAYGKGSIDEAGWFDLKLRYVGNLQIEKSKALLLDSRYSKLTLGETSSVVGECKYDNIKIDEINNLVLENGYTTISIGTLTKKLNYNGSYGSLTVQSIPAGFDDIDIESHYMGVKLGIEVTASYKLDAKVSYGGLSYDEDNFNNQKRYIQNNSKEISGTVGKDDNPSATVRVISSYGSVRLY